MSFRPYPSYRASGIEWLGEMPEHWEVKRMKHLAELTMGQSPSSNEFNDEGLGLPFLQGNADFGHTSPEPRTYCEVATKFANPTEILLSVRAPVGAINIANQKFAIGRGLCSIEAGSEYSMRFLYHALHVVRDELTSVATGSTYKAVTIDQVANAQCTCPPLLEQTVIAAFLDRETAKIDELVTEQRRLMELLKEKRQAVISHAVTKGLNPDVSMKPSGVEWLGDVPEHWEVVGLKHLVSRPIIDGPHETPEKFDEGIPFVSAESVSKGFINLDKKWGYISPEDHARYSKRYSPQRGDILLVKLGATTGTLAIVETDVIFNIWVPLAAIRLKPETQSRLVFHVLRSDNLKRAYELNWTYGTQQTLGLNTISNLRIPLPPKQEQEDIVQHLDSFLPSFEALTTEAQRAIDLLNERRVALISAAVTGQIDVRGLVESEAA